MSRKVLISAAVAAWLVIFLPVGYCLAQSGNLQRVVVTDRFEKLPLTIEEKAQPTVIQQFDSVDIENSAAEVLSDFLAEKGIGVYKSPTDQGHTLTTIRGFRTDHLSKELDGRVLFLVNGHRTGTANSTQIPLLNVERVEILRGPEMLRYSGASPGGVINVVTKKGGPDKLDGSVEVGYGSAETFKAKGKLGGMVNNFDYSLGYGFYKKGDYKDGNGRKVLHTGVAANHSLMAEIGYSFNDNHRISWSTYLYYVDKAERPAYVD
ncbi:MAG: TonB-dependent receptor plug domain-containing protein, partial [Deltaproteobacteria bacterium]|nr:TonB-dependent receptor plug domain-containing protein [Deltaproteobacteria bacterium]